MSRDRQRPKTFFRRVERWLVGIVMGMIAFTLEKAVMRAIKKKGDVPKIATAPDPRPPFATSRGKDVVG